MSDVTRILHAIEQGDRVASDELLPLVYEELRKLAAHKMASEAPGQTLQPTALVHEAWLKLVGEPDRKFRGRDHFFAAAAEAMRRILIDNARRKLAQRHGGGQQRVDVLDIEIPAVMHEDDVLVLNDALDKLAALLPELGCGQSGLLATGDHVEDAAAGLLGVMGKEHRLGDQRIAGD